jgi:hypothetical protein
VGVQAPELNALERGLSRVFECDRASLPGVTVIRREANVYSSTYTSEILTCRLPNGTEHRLLCKYGAPASQSGHGHRGGLGYEGLVHRDVLSRASLTRPTFYGAHEEPSSGEVWLALEYLDEARHVSKTPDGMQLAARWIGQFHAANAARLVEGNLPRLAVYDAAYYLGWTHRTTEYARRLRRPMPWLTALCARFEEVIPLLQAAQATVIHGEYYVKNILQRGQAIYPVDWESAAIGPGEIDLASLAEGWGADVVNDCEREYRWARWPSGAPALFEDTLTAARLYWVFRWGGESECWDTYRRRLASAEQLRRAAALLGLA